MFRLGSLFSGSGGFELAGAINGIEPAWASEIEPYPIRVTNARFPGMKHLGSVLDVDGGKVEPVDIITFGSPCQDLSVAGKQAGLHKGERSNLFFEAIRIIKEMRESTNGKYPRIAVWENVPGAYSSNKGEDFRAVLEAFAQINDEAADVPRPASGKWNPAGAIVGNGWSIAWRTFDAQFWGVPQRRKRIYLIADFGSERAGKILFEQESVRGHSAESGEAGEGAATDAEGSPRGGRECLTPWDVQSKRIYREDSKWPGLCTGKRICDGSVLISAADAERGVGGDCEIVGFQSSQSGFRLCATHATIDANNGSRRQNGVCYPAGDAEGSAGRGCAYGLTTKGNGDAFIAEERHMALSCGGGQAGQGYPAIIYSVDCRNMNLTKEHGTLQAKENGGQSLNYMGAVCYAAAFKYGNSAEARSIGYQEEISPTLQAGEGGNQKPVVCYPINTMVATRWNKDDNRTTFGIGEPGDPQFTLGAAHEHAVCYPIDSHQQDSRFRVCDDGIAPTLPGQMGTGGNNGPMVLEPAKPPRKYIIRRLTPLECARLQGFPDWWETGVQGSDSARYKMWGNGIALPNAAYVVGCAKRLIQGGPHGD